MLAHLEFKSCFHTWIDWRFSETRGLLSLSIWTCEHNHCTLMWRSPRGGRGPWLYSFKTLERFVCSENTADLAKATNSLDTFCLDTRRSLVRMNNISSVSCTRFAAFTRLRRLTEPLFVYLRFLETFASLLRLVSNRWEMCLFAKMWLRHFTSSLHQVNRWLMLSLSLLGHCPTMTKRPVCN